MIKRRTAIFIFSFFCVMGTIILAAYNFIAPKFKYQPPLTKVSTAFKATSKLNSFYVYDTSGSIFTDKSLRGHWTLLFFGYTKCPDICPRTLGIIRETFAMFAAQDKISPVRFVFADISPQPVGLAELKQFVRNYNPEFIGITGSSNEMHTLSDQLGIYSQQMSDSIDHTSALMLIDPQGSLNAIITPPFSAADLVHDLTILTL